MFARIVAISITLTLLTAWLAVGARAETEVRVGWCARTISAAALAFISARRSGSIIDERPGRSFPRNMFAAISRLGASINS